MNVDMYKKKLQELSYLNWCGKGKPNKDDWDDWFHSEELYEQYYRPLNAPDAWLYPREEDAQWEVENADLMVRTINVYGPGPGNCLGKRLSRIAGLIHHVYPSKAGLIGVQELFQTSDCDGAAYFAEELRKKYKSPIAWDYNEKTNAIFHDDEWVTISRDYKELGHRLSNRFVLENVLQHKTKGWKLRFYTTHISWVEKNTTKQIVDLVKWVVGRALPGELPPIVTGDFNDGGRNLKGGTPSAGVLEMEKHFWRPMDLGWTTGRVEGLSDTGIDVIYIGKKTSFPRSYYSYVPIATHNLWFSTEFKDTDTHPRITELYLTDHHSRAVTLEVKGVNPTPVVQSYRNESIQSLAFCHWKARGCPANDSWTDWFWAEKEWYRKINEIAYLQWLHRGKPLNDNLADWFWAEKDFYWNNTLEYKYTNPKVHDVTKLFNLFGDDSRRGRELIKMDVTEDGSERDPESGNNPESHIQGIISGERYSLLTHSKRKGDFGYIYIIDRQTGKMTHAVTENPRYDHPGGCQSLGNFAFIPEEKINDDDDKIKSIISLYEFGSKKNDKMFLSCTCPQLIYREKKAEGMGVTNFTCNAVEKILIGVLYGNTVDFYLADYERVFNCSAGFKGKKRRGNGEAYNIISLSSHGLEEGDKSNICLVTDSSNNIYLFAFRSKKAAGRESRLDLYRVSFLDSPFEIESVTYIGSHTVTMIEPDHTYGLDDSIRFRWGAGIQIINPKRIDVWVTEMDLGDPLYLNRFILKK